MAQIFDLFLSYRWADKPSVEPVLAALAARGVSVWQDAREVEDLASIQHSVSAGLASARALLAWYSLRYNDSRACQWELTSAYAAGQAEGDPRRRVLVVNPEPSNAHVFLPELFDQLHLSGQGVVGDSAAVGRLADRVVAALASVPSAPLGSVQSLTPPQWVPAMGTGSNRFVGRLREMWALHGKLQAGQAAMLTGTGGKAGLALVRGAGGIGKSLLAEEYALRFGVAYPGGVFWLRAFGYADGGVEMTPQQRSVSRESQFIDMAERLGIDTKGMTAAQVSGALGRHLKAEGKPFLWVVDDFPGDGRIEEIGAWQAPDPLGCTLFTSRTRRFEHLATIELPLLDPVDARNLLVRHRALSPEETAAADEICELLGYHALAVDVTAALVQRRGLAGARDALRHPGRDALELAAQLDEALPNGHQRQIAATFLASIEQLDEPARDLLRDAAVLAVAPIPVELLVRCRSVALGIDEAEARDTVDVAVSQAVAASLADEAGAGLISVHALVSRTLRFAQPDPEVWAVRRVRVLQVLASRMEQAHDIRAHGRLAGWIEQARALSSKPEDTPTADLRGWAARFDLERGAYALAKEGFERVLATRRRVLGNEHLDTLAAMNNLASTLMAQGDLTSARSLHEQVLMISRRMLGNEHPATLTSMTNLAHALGDLGQMAGARNLQEQALAVQRRVLGDEHPSTLTSMNNLASSLRAQGDLTGSRKLMEQALAVQHRVLGEEHPDTLTSMNNLARTLLDLGDRAGAQRLQEQVLTIRRRVLGDEHANTLTTMANLAATLRFQGDLAGARSLQEQALAIQRRVLGDEHPSTLTSLNNQAGILRAQGDLAGASSLQEHVLAIRRRVLGDEHPNTLTSAANLAGTLQAQGDFAGAHRLQAQVLAIRRRVQGEEHPDTLGTMNNLAITLWYQGKREDAIAYMAHAARGMAAVLGVEHPATKQSAGSLAQMQRDSG